MKKISLKNRNTQRICALLVAIIIAFVPNFSTKFIIFLMSRMLFMGLLSMSFVLLFGFGGMMSFAQVGLYGISGYLLAIGTLKLGIPYWMSMLLAVVFTMVFAFLYAAAVVRTKGNYFLMITLALTQLVSLVGLQWVPVTGGWNGLSGIPVGNFIGGSLMNVKPMFYLILLVVTICYFILKQFQFSPFGLALQATRDEQKKVDALGINSQKVRYFAIVFAAFFAALAGVLGSSFYRLMAPNMVSMSYAVMLLFMALIGGYTKFEGSLIGAVVYILFEDTLSMYTDRYMLFIGILFILIVLFLPNGVLGIRRKTKRLYSETE